MVYMYQLMKYSKRRRRRRRRRWTGRPVREGGAISVNRVKTSDNDLKKVLLNTVLQTDRKFT